MLEGAEKMEGEVVTRADGGRGLVEAGVVVGGGWVGRVRGGSVVEGIMWKGNYHQLHVKIHRYICIYKTWSLTRGQNTSYRLGAKMFI